MNKALFSSEKMNWGTPPALFEELNAEFGFTLDAAASDTNAKCDTYFTLETDGLKQSWEGHTVFCNPPYGTEIWKWAKKCEEESRLHGVTVVLLVPARTDTKWFHEYVYGKAEIRFCAEELNL